MVLCFNYVPLQTVITRFSFSPCTTLGMRLRLGANCNQLQCILKQKEYFWGLAQSFPNDVTYHAAPCTTTITVCVCQMSSHTHKWLSTQLGHNPINQHYAPYYSFRSTMAHKNFVQHRFKFVNSISCTYPSELTLKAVFFWQLREPIGDTHTKHGNPFTIITKTKQPHFPLMIYFLAWHFLWLWLSGNTHHIYSGVRD